VQRVRDCLFADDVLYDVERGVWVRVSGSSAFVGIDSILAWISGPFTAVSFKEEGTVVERGMSLGSVEGPRHFDTVRSPLTCRIVEANLALKGNPRLLNREPYGGGWFVRVEPLNMDGERSGLLSIAAARGSLDRRVVELHVRCFAEFPDLEMFEIGSECAGILVKLDEVMQSSPIGTVVHLVSDDTTAEIELIGWSERTGQTLVESRREGNLFHFIIRKTR
jgi:glycine cleavage system H protein